MRRARHTRVGSECDQHARLLQTADVVERELEFAQRLAHPRRVHVRWRRLTRLDRLIDGQGRRIGRLVRLHVGDGFRVDLAVLEAVHDDVHARPRRLAATRHGHRVGHDLDVARMGGGDNGGQGGLVHAGVVRRLPIAPAVGEHLDQVGRIGGDGFDPRAAGLGRVDPAGGVLIGPVGAVAARRAYACGQVDVRRRQDRQPATARLESLRGLVEVIDRRHARLDVGGGDVGRNGRNAAGRPMGVNVEESGQQGLAPGVDDPSTARRPQPRADLDDPTVADQDITAIRGRPGCVEDLCARNEQRGLGRLGRPAAKADEGGHDRGDRAGPGAQASGG
ncbi:hypothetical protein D3C77_249360 [compost metagenome]